jgi:hypothetical protein
LAHQGLQTHVFPMSCHVHNSSIRSYCYRITFRNLYKARLSAIFFTISSPKIYTPVRYSPEQACLRRPGSSSQWSNAVRWDLRFSRRGLWKIAPSGMWHHVAVVTTDVSEERIVSIIRVEAMVLFLRSVLQLLVTANLFSSPILSALMMEEIRSTETTIPTKTTRSHMPEDGMLDIVSCYWAANTWCNELLRHRPSP